MPKKITKGFTILELLVVLVVLGVFSAVAYPNITKWITDREVKKAAYDVVALIKELQSEVNSGKYGMILLNLEPGFNTWHMSNQDFIKTYKDISSSNPYKSGRYCTDGWKQTTLKFTSSKQPTLKFYANAPSSAPGGSLTSYPSGQSFDRKQNALCITKDSTIKFVPQRNSKSTERDPSTGETVDVFVICHRSVSPNQGDCRPDQTKDYRYKITINTFKNTKIYKYNKKKNSWISIDG